MNIYAPEEYHGDPDVLIIFAKQMTLQDLLERSSHFFAPDHQYVFSGMNGMGHIEKINQYFPKENVIGGTCLIGTVLNKAGTLTSSVRLVPVRSTWPRKVVGWTTRGYKKLSPTLKRPTSTVT